MNNTEDLLIPAKRHQIQAMPSTSLPMWETLSSERRRELVITLAAMLIKQLGACHRTGREGTHE
jgi:glycine cleavage system regulatory protein